MDQLSWAKRLQAIAQAGLTFSKDEFDRERYDEILSISTEMLQAYVSITDDEVRSRIELDPGYPTPKNDVRGVVFQDDAILLVKEKKDQRWALPGGFCEVNLSPSENIVKEIEEEAGIKTIPFKLLALLDKHKHNHPADMYHYYKIFIQCEAVAGQLSAGVETSEAAFFQEDKLPELSLSRNTKQQIQLMFEYKRNPNKPTLFD